MSGSCKCTIDIFKDFFYEQNIILKKVISMRYTEVIQKKYKENPLYNNIASFRSRETFCLKQKRIQNKTLRVAHILPRFLVWKIVR